MDNDQEKELVRSVNLRGHFLHTAEKQEAKTRHLYRLCRVTAMHQNLQFLQCPLGAASSSESVSIDFQVKMCDFTAEINTFKAW